MKSRIKSTLSLLEWGACTLLLMNGAAAQNTFPVKIEQAERVDRSSAAWPWVYLGTDTLQMPAERYPDPDPVTGICLGTTGTGALARVRCVGGGLWGPMFYCPSDIRETHAGDVVIGGIHMRTYVVSSDDGYNPTICEWRGLGATPVRTRSYELYIAGGRWACPVGFPPIDLDQDGSTTHDEINIVGPNPEACGIYTCPAGSHLANIPGDPNAIPAGLAAGKVCVSDCIEEQCDDDLVCTIDACFEDGPGCENEFDKTLCVCNNPAPPQVTKTISKQFPKTPTSTACPIFGGSKKMSLTLDGQFGLQASACNNDCTSSTAGAANLTGSFELCGITVTAKGSGSYSYQEKGCINCDEETCEQSCSEATCDTKTAAAGLEAKVSKFFGADINAGDDDYGLSSKCGATISVSGAINGSSSSTSGEATSCESCGTCAKESTSGSLGGGAQADCLLELRAGGMKNEIGCVSCGLLDIKGTVSHEGEEGDAGCGEANCISSRADAKAVVASPMISIKTAWWSVDVRCQATATACSENNTCGAPSCKDDADDTDGSAASVKLSCSVGL